MWMTTERYGGEQMPDMVPAKVSTQLESEY